MVNAEGLLNLPKPTILPPGTSPSSSEIGGNHFTAAVSEQRIFRILRYTSERLLKLSERLLKQWNACCEKILKQ